jgi:transposase InsO family protein
MNLVPDYPARLVCRLLDFPRCQVYRTPRRRSAGDADLRAALQRLAGEWPTYGYRRLTALLRREGQAVNSKRVRRLMAAMGIQGLRPVRRQRTTDSTHDFPRFPNLVEGLEVVRPDQLWVADITYIRLRPDFVYLAVIMDVFTRRIRGWHLGRDLAGTLTLAALERALRNHRPDIHHSDQGVQYAATDYVDRLRQVEAGMSMAAVGKPEENGFAERLIRTIKEEEVDLSEYQDFADADRQLGRFWDAVYNHKRIHSALGYRSRQSSRSSGAPGRAPERRRASFPTSFSLLRRSAFTGAEVERRKREKDAVDRMECTSRNGSSWSHFRGALQRPGYGTSFRSCGCWRSVRWTS